jgi:glycosyltransferase involved in cell wall biosynthesis
MKKIAFHSNQLSLRGTEIALYAYAKYNEEILGNKSVIVSFPNRDHGAIEKFRERFEVVLMEWCEYETYLTQNNFDYLYLIKMGTNDGYCLQTVPCLIHAVFRFNDPHGHKYFYVSDWLAKDQGYDPETYSLPHICEKLPEAEYNFREKHNIPENARVFGCYGGSTEFNIESTKQAIRKAVEEHDDIYFIFMNIQEFADHPQIKFYPGNYDLKEKSAFVNACDAMIHARRGGETFGLAVSEFALSNKPVITYELSGERSHLDILGERAILYKGYEDLLDIFVNFPLYIKYTDYDLPYKQFSPELIMKKFEKLL